MHPEICRVRILIIQLVQHTVDTVYDVPVHVRRQISLSGLAMALVSFGAIVPCEHI